MPEFDVSQRFTIENTGARGELVRLKESYSSAFEHVDYPEPLKILLGEAMCAAVLLSATIKFEGKLSIQLQGQGPITLMLVQATHDRKVRGMIKWTGSVEGKSFTELTSNPQFAITIEPDEGKRYQGIVPFQGEKLSDCLEHYFLQSEQLPTQVWLTADSKAAAGFLLQKLPGHDGDGMEESWEHISIIAKSITDNELLELDFETILYRLFHSEKVRVNSPQPTSFQCVCSLERCENAVVNLGAEEINSMIEEEQLVKMTCEFCGASYFLDIDRLQELSKSLKQ